MLRCSRFPKAVPIAPLRPRHKMLQKQRQLQKISWNLQKFSKGRLEFRLEPGEFSPDYWLGEISFRSICVGSRSALGGGCTTRSKRVPLSRCIFFFAESRTVPCDPSEVGVYTFTSGLPKAPLLSGENIPSEFNSPSAAAAANSGVRNRG